MGDEKMCTGWRLNHAPPARPAWSVTYHHDDLFCKTTTHQFGEMRAWAT